MLVINRIPQFDGIVINAIEHRQNMLQARQIKLYKDINIREQVFDIDVS